MPGFFAGTAERDITPTRQELDELGSNLFSTKTLFPKGVAQPVCAKALATSDGDRTVLLFSADLLATPLWMANEIRAGLQEITGLPARAIAICTSQTHSSAPVERNTPYTNRLIQEFVAIGAAAVSNLRPAKIGAGRGLLPSLCYNSDLNITEQTPTDICPEIFR